MPRVHEMLESKFLKKEDCGEDGTVVTVTDFERVNVAMDDQPPEHKWTMRFKEMEKPMVMNATNLQLCEKIFGSDNTDDWLGKKLIVYSDPNISFGGKLVGGIRVRAFRQAGAPRQPGTNGTDDAGPDPKTMVAAEEDLIEASAKGTEALKGKFLALTGSLRNALRTKYEELKPFAAKADAIAEDDIPF